MGGNASYGELLGTSLLVLGVVCTIALVAVRLFGRFAFPGRTRGAHLMDVIDRVALEPRRSLYVVSVAGKTLLVGTSEMGLNVLTELDAGAIGNRAGPPASFGELVRAAWVKRRSNGRGADMAELPSQPPQAS
jgi:flagellar biogenesis protein FliO